MEFNWVLGADAVVLRTPRFEFGISFRLPHPIFWPCAAFVVVALVFRDLVLRDSTRDILLEGIAQIFSTAAHVGEVLVQWAGVLAASCRGKT